MTYTQHIGRSLRPVPTGDNIARDWSLDRRHPRKSWYIQATDDGVMIAPVYNGQFGCRLWYVPTIGM